MEQTKRGDESEDDFYDSEEEDHDLNYQSDNEYQEEHYDSDENSDRSSKASDYDGDRADLDDEWMLLSPGVADADDVSDFGGLY